ncbi:DnaA-like protein [Candidatus Hepatincolaceae symbiont of Richtersius coronifer]
MPEQQLFFNFDPKQDAQIYNYHNLIIGKFNKHLYDFLFTQQVWRFNVIFIFGNQGVGKTSLIISYLLKFQLKWQTINLSNWSNATLKTNILEEAILKNDVLLLEDLGPLSRDQEVQLFNFYNLVINLNKKLIITSLNPPSMLDINLADLKSRLKAAIIFKIDNPEDELLEPLFIKILADKQLIVTPEVMHYILKRIPRTCKSIQVAANKLEVFIMQERKNLTVALAKQALDLN